MAYKRIKDLTNTATEADLVAGNYFALDGSAGTKKLNSTTLLTKTAQNALGNIEPEYDSVTGAVAGKLYTHEGALFCCNEDVSGAWDASKFTKINLEDFFAKKVGGVAPNSFKHGVDFKELASISVEKGYRITSYDSNHIIVKTSTAGFTLYKIDIEKEMGCSIRSDSIYVKGQNVGTHRFYTVVKSNGYQLAQSSDDVNNESMGLYVSDGKTTIKLNEIKTLYPEAKYVYIGMYDDDEIDFYLYEGVPYIVPWLPINELEKEVSGLSVTKPKMLLSSVGTADLIEGYTFMMSARLASLSVGATVVPLTNSNFVTHKFDLSKFKTCKFFSQAPYNHSGSFGTYQFCVLADKDNKVVTSAIGPVTTANYGIVFANDKNFVIDSKYFMTNYPNVKYLYFCMETANNVGLGIDGNIALPSWANDINEIIPIPEIIVPKESVAVVGHQWNMFFTACVNGLCDGYEVAISSPTLNNISNVHFLGDCLRVTPASGEEGDYNIIISVVAKNGGVVDSKSFTLHVVNDASLPNLKAIMLGDSLTDDGWYPCEIQGNLSGGKITMVGTKSDTRTIDGNTITAANEGRGGWSVTDYTTKASYGVSNAFWNPNTSKFDFSYYMTTNGFTGVDVVSILLGTNGDPKGWVDTIAGLKEIITSIHAYDPDIKVIINLLQMPAKQDGVGNHNKMQRRASIILAEVGLNKKFIENFQDNENFPNVYVNPMNFLFDCDHDYPLVEQQRSARNTETVYRQNNNVHPALCGYLEFADAIYNEIVYLFQ